MAAQEKITQGSILTETAASNLTINRSVTWAGPNGSFDPKFAVGINYADTEYLLDPEGKKTRVLASGMNSRYFSMSEVEVGTLFGLKLTLEDGTETVLGELLAKLMDDAIRVDVAKQVATPGQPI